MESLNNKQELIAHYEELRALVLEPSNESSTIIGFSVFILRGMTSWIKTYLSLEPSNLAVSSVNNLEATDNPVRSSYILSQIQKEVTTILTNMIIFNQLHKKEEHHHV